MLSEPGRYSTPVRGKGPGQKYWENMDKHFYEILDESKQGFKFKKTDMLISTLSFSRRQFFLIMARDLL
jgi:hypothetical protein